MNESIINKLLDCAGRGAEIHFVNISMPSKSSGTSTKVRSRKRGRKQNKNRRGRNIVFHIVCRNRQA